MSAAVPTDPTTAQVMTMLLDLKKVDGDKVSWDSGGTQTCFYSGGSVSYDKTSLVLNETATATVIVKNNTASAQNMIMVTLGLPPGSQVATEDLDAYKRSKVLSAYEIWGKQLMLYLSALPASSSQTFKYHLQATMPVTASDGGAEVYLYYQPKQRSAAAAVTLQVLETPATPI
jgi:uncharacterized protein YfaS (alpha-2-macroglobulin family)